MCKRCEAFSLQVLIGRGLDLNMIYASTLCYSILKIQDLQRYFSEDYMFKEFITEDYIFNQM